MSEPAEQVIDANKQRFFDFQEIWNFRELFFFFAWRDIKIKYKQTVLGFLWAILQPLLMMIIFTYFFGRVLQVPSQDLPYPVFVFSGLLLWNMFAGGLTNAANSMVNNAGIIKKIFFPRLIIPVSAIFVSAFDFLMAFAVFITMIFFYGQPVALNAIILWPVAVILSTLAILGPGCLLAALNVKYRDFRYVIPFVIQVIFFITPVLYPVSMLSDPLLRYLVTMSPMYAAIEFFRMPLSHVAPQIDLLMISITSTLVLTFIGLVYFRRTEQFFAELA